MSTHIVNTLELNLRRSPRNEVNTNIIATLPEGQEVELLEGLAGDQWWRVSTLFQSTTITGYVAKRFLIERDGFDTRTFSAVEEIHLPIQNPSSRRELKTGRAYPLGEDDKPFRDTANVASKKASLHQIVGWLAVTEKNRYLREANSTFCNIYAYDYCYLGRAYLPRVWWRPSALVRLSQGLPVRALYAQTIGELNANSLYQWLEEHGEDFGWERVFDVETLQNAANNGDVCVICAKRVNLNDSGHITVVLPETDLHKAQRSGQNDKVQIPLQSQAGGVNRQYFNNQKWWTDPKFRSFGFWRHA